MSHFTPQFQYRHLSNISRKLCPAPTRASRVSVGTGSIIRYGAFYFDARARHIFQKLSGGRETCYHYQNLLGFLAIFLSSNFFSDIAQKLLQIKRVKKRSAGLALVEIDLRMLMKICDIFERARLTSEANGREKKEGIRENSSSCLKMQVSQSQDRFCSEKGAVQSCFLSLAIERQASDYCPRCNSIPTVFQATVRSRFTWMP